MLKNCSICGTAKYFNASKIKLIFKLLAYFKLTITNFYRPAKQMLTLPAVKDKNICAHRHPIIKF